jgi:hypothetical protein
MPEEIEDEEIGPMARKDQGEDQGEIADGGQVQKWLEGQRYEGVEEVVGVQSQADAQGVEDVVGEEGVGVEIQEGVFEPPDVPEESVLVEGPDIGAGHMSSEMGYQGIGEEKS